jgi:ribosomal protein S18 acetylase RimI-like enzyme
VLIRSLELKDIAGVTSVHLASFPDTMLVKFGTETVRRYYEWWLGRLLGEPHKTAGLSAFIGAELVGFCIAGKFRGHTSEFLRENRAFLMRRILTHPWAMVSLLRPKFRQQRVTGVRSWRSHTRPSSTVTPAKENSLHVQFLVVHPAHRRRGIGRLLMNEIEAAARQRGFSRMHLSTSLDNHQAISLYESLNWEKIPELGGGKRNMVKHLTSSSPG